MFTRAGQLKRILRYVCEMEIPGRWLLGAKPRPFLRQKLQEYYEQREPGSRCPDPDTQRLLCSVLCETRGSRRHGGDRRPPMAIWAATRFADRDTQTDASISKKFSLTARISLHVKFDAYNIPNRVNLAEPVMDLNNNNFGRSVDQLNPKACQAYLRLMF